MNGMQALRFSLQPLRAAYAAVAGGRRPEAWAGGAGSPLRLTEVPRPGLPGPEWVRIRVDRAGICASDLKLIRVTGLEPVVTAFADWRQAVVPGHEVVGTVVEAGSAAPVAEGSRVVAEPVLSCRDKRLTACAACREGDDHRCANIAEPGALCVGNGFGFNARFGGGWSEEIVAPAWRCVEVPAALGDADAVLAEPVAVAVHAVARTPPPRAGRALIIGPGAIGLSTLLALRHLVPGAAVDVAGLGAFADDRARRLGASALLHGTGDALVRAGAEASGARLGKPLLDRPVAVAGGYDIVYDCVASEQTIADAQRLLRPGGSLVLVGTAGRQRVDWTLVWFRELRVVGTVYYAAEPVADPEGGTRRAFDIAVEVLTTTRPGTDLVTHRFPLEDATLALRTAAAGPAASAVRVTFAPSA